MHGQGVHVPAQQYRACAGAAAQHRDDTAGRGPGAIIQRQPAQCGHDLGRGLRRVQTEFGFGMDGTAQADQIRQ